MQPEDTMYDSLSGAVAMIILDAPRLLELCRFGFIILMKSSTIRGSFNLPARREFSKAVLLLLVEV